MPSAAHLFRAIPFSGKSVALAVSACLHAAVALAAARGAPHASPSALLAQEPALDLAPVEIALTDPPERPIQTRDPASATASAPPARHHHDYAVAPDHDATAHDPSLRHVLPLASPPMAAPVATPAAAPSVVDSRAPAVARFVMTVGASTRAQAGTGIETGKAETAASTGSTAPVAESSVDTPAKLLIGGTPSYTREAEAAGIEADVPLEIVVDASGAVIGARALAHVGYGLDDAALRSVRGYRFSPARRGGAALAVRMRWLMRFQLR